MSIEQVLLGFLAVGVVQLGGINSEQSDLGLVDRYSVSIHHIRRAMNFVVM